MLCPLLALKNRLDQEHARELEAKEAELKSLQFLHEQELRKLRDLHMEDKIKLLQGLCEKSASAPKNVNNITNNSITLRDLNDLTEHHVAGRLTSSDFWRGQLGVADCLKRCSAADGHQWHHIRDENRGKVEVLIDGEKVRDDHFTKTIEKLEGWMVEDIRKRACEQLEREAIIESLGPEAVLKVEKSCLDFKDSSRNKPFIPAMRRRDA